VRGLVLAALLLVPVVTSAHHHAADSASAESCAVCLVAHHAPAAVTAAPVAFSLTLASVAPETIQVDPPAQRLRTPIAGRAPPFVSSSLSAS